MPSQLTYKAAYPDNGYESQYPSNEDYEQSEKIGCPSYLHHRGEARDFDDFPNKAKRPRK